MAQDAKHFTGFGGAIVFAEKPETLVATSGNEPLEPLLSISIKVSHRMR